jgi:hypothetical protein
MRMRMRMRMRMYAYVCVFVCVSVRVCVYAHVCAHVRAYVCGAQHQGRKHSNGPLLARRKQPTAGTHSNADTLALGHAAPTPAASRNCERAECEHGQGGRGGGGGAQQCIWVRAPAPAVRPAALRSPSLPCPPRTCSRGARCSRPATIATTGVGRGRMRAAAGHGARQQRRATPTARWRTGAAPRAATARPSASALPCCVRDATSGWVSGVYRRCTRVRGGTTPPP